MRSISLLIGIVVSCLVSSSAQAYCFNDSCPDWVRGLAAPSGNPGPIKDAELQSLFNTIRWTETRTTGNFSLYPKLTYYVYDFEEKFVNLGIFRFACGRYWIGPGRPETIGNENCIFLKTLGLPKRSMDLLTQSRKNGDTIHIDYYKNPNKTASNLLVRTWDSAVADTLSMLGDYDDYNPEFEKQKGAHVAHLTIGKDQFVGFGPCVRVLVQPVQVHYTKPELVNESYDTLLIEPQVRGSDSFKKLVLNKYNFGKTQYQDTIECVQGKSCLIKLNYFRSYETTMKIGCQ